MRHAEYNGDYDNKKLSHSASYKVLESTYLSLVKNLSLFFLLQISTRRILAHCLVFLASVRIDIRNQTLYTYYLAKIYDGRDS